MKEKLDRYLIPLSLFIVSVIIIFPYLHKNIILSGGESATPINASYVNPYFIWNDKINLGSYFHLQSFIYLFSIFWKILNFTSFIIHPSVAFIFMTFFLPGLFFYIMSHQILKLSNRLYYLPSSLLYSFNIYRIQINYVNENISLLFIFLPLFFLFYYKLLEKKRWKYVYTIAVISIAYSTAGNNIAVFFIPFTLMFIYFIYKLFYLKMKDLKIIFTQNIALILLITIGNLFWLFPLFSYLFLSFNNRFSSLTFQPTSAGYFFDHFRYMGFWAWRSMGGISLYFPYSVNYDKPILIITTYTISIISFVYIFYLKKNSYLALKYFLLLLSVISFTLLSGIKGPLGFIYQFFYNTTPLFKIYREPYTKFTPLSIFATSFGLVLSIFYVFNSFKNRYIKYILTSITCLLILFNAYPLFTTEAMKFKRWDNNQRGTVAIIPNYWKDLKTYLNNNQINQRITLFPNNGYSTTHNWEYGVNVVGNIADYLINNELIKMWEIDESQSGYVINSFNRAIVADKDSEINLKNFLSLLSSTYILQENDAEWRYSGKRILPPSISNDIIQNQDFKKVAEFGKFTPEYLAKIPNDEPNKALHDELYKELTNKPALVLYKADPEYFLPHFYSPQDIILTNQKVENITQIVSQPEYNIRSAIFFKRQNKDKLDSLKTLKLNDKNQLVNTPVIEYKKINPTKYKVVIHNAKDSFPLVLSESYHDGWKAYITKYQIPKSKVQITNELNNYKIIDGNIEDQATKDEVKSFIDKGLMSTVGANFISKNIKDTIQNDNLPNGIIFETWFKKPIDDSKHLLVNGYANSWLINPQEFCNNNSLCKKNINGSFNLTLLIDFWPQRFFVIGAFISIATLLVCLTYLLYHYKVGIFLTFKNI